MHHRRAGCGPRFARPQPGGAVVESSPWPGPSRLSATPVRRRPRIWGVEHALDRRWTSGVSMRGNWQSIASSSWSAAAWSSGRSRPMGSLCYARPGNAPSAHASSQRPHAGGVGGARLVPLGKGGRVLRRPAAPPKTCLPGRARNGAEPASVEVHGNCGREALQLALATRRARMRGGKRATPTPPRSASGGRAWSWCRARATSSCARASSLVP